MFNILHGIESVLGGLVNRVTGNQPQQAPQAQQAPQQGQIQPGASPLEALQPQDPQASFYPSLDDQIQANSQKLALQNYQSQKPGLAQDAEQAIKGIAKDVVSPVTNSYEAAKDASQPGTGIGQQAEDFIKGVTSPEQPAINLGAEAGAQVTGKAQPTVNGDVKSFSQTPLSQTASNVLGTAALGLDGLSVHPDVVEAPETPEAPVEATTAPAKAPEVPVTPETPSVAQSPAPIPQGAPKDGYQAIQDGLNSSNPDEYTGSRVGGTQVLQGRVEGGQLLADNLADQIKSDLPNAADRTALSNYLDDPTTEVSPKVQAVAARIKPILDQAAEIRQTFDPDFNPVNNYFTRAIKGQTDYRAASLDSEHPTTKSQYSNPRSIDKFTNNDTGDEVVGDPKKMGLKEQPDGSYASEDGNAFTRSQATRDEVKAGPEGIPLEDDAAKVLPKYLADTYRLKEHGLYLDQIKSQFGIDPATADTNALTQANVDSYRTTKAKGLEGVLFPPKVADAIDQMTARGPQNIIVRAFNGLTGALRNIAVTNPIVHPGNLEVQGALAAGGPLKAARYAANQVKSGLDFSKDPDYLEMKNAGGTGMGIGQTRIFRQLAAKIAPNSERIMGAGEKLDSYNPASLNAKIVNHVDEGVRLGVYKTLKEDGMEPKAAVARMNKFLGDYGKGLGKDERAIANVSFFYRWLKTEATSLGAIGSDIAHGKGGSLVTFAAIGATLYGVEKAWQKETGNPNATIRFPGVFGLVRDAIDLPGQIHDGQEPTLLSGHTNPVVQQALEQYKNKNFFTGKSITDQSGVAGLKDRAKFALGETFGQSAEGKFGNGNKATGEKVANLLGFNTPHVKGAPAAPGLPGSALNLPNAVAEKGPDPTGIEQASTYAQTTRAALGTLTQKTDQDAFNSLKDKFSDPNTGKPIQSGPLDTLTNDKTLLDHPAVLAAFQKQAQAYAQQTGQPLDPKWALSGTGIDANGQTVPKLQAYISYESQYAGDPIKTLMEQQNPWLAPLATARSAFYTANPIPVSTTSETNQTTPVYPTFDPQTQSLLTQYDASDAAQKSALINANPQIGLAFDQIGKYTNEMRVAQDAPAQVAYPTASSAVESALQAKNYNAPGVQNYLTSVSLYNIAKGGAVAALQGGTAPANYLKSIYEAGNYDITKNADGSYSISSGGSGSSSSSGTIHIKFPTAKALKLSVGPSGARKISFKFKPPAAGKAPSVVAKSSTKPQEAGAPGAKSATVKSVNETVHSGTVA